MISMKRGVLGRWAAAVVAIGALSVGATADDQMTSDLNVELSYYLPTKDVSYDPNIPTPASHFGFNVGERHLTHAELVGYLRELDRASDRITMETHGMTHGRRPLTLLTVTSPSNQKRIESIRERHVQLTDPDRSDGIDVTKEPAVLWLCFSVHGDESSGSNAAPLVAYYLAAARGERVNALLANTVILIDPSLNPDGMDRFAHWVNMTRGHTPSSDPNHREHDQPWPGGRTNYYYFDLNRDWLPAAHPESRGRLEIFHRWKPNILNDYHEMGSGSTFFFQPGVPERKNPLTPERNVELTGQLAGFHARALDRAGSTYFTEERFDDFYMGKGSTYPDLHGSIGILFEQASSGGMALETETRTLTFPYTVRNQVLVTFSTFDAILDMREELLSYQRAFYRESKMLGSMGDVGGWVFSAPGDRARLARFAELLRVHDIRVHALRKPVTVDGVRYEPGEAFIAPTKQAAFRFLKSLFERRTSFEKNVFYDVSTWTLPLAFNMQYGEVSAKSIDDVIGEPIENVRIEYQRNVPRSSVGYVIEWSSSEAPLLVRDLLRNDVQVRVATKPFTLHTQAGEREFSYGTILVPVGPQRARGDAIHRILREGARQYAVRVHAASSGLTPIGADLGSGSFSNVARPKIIIVAGAGTSAYSVGEAWHFLDHRLGFEVTMLDADDLDNTDLDAYTAIVIADSRLRGGDSTVNALRTYVRGGGTIVATGSGATWCIRSGLSDVVLRERPGSASANPDEPVDRRAYADADDDRAKHLVAGSIFETSIDHTHPVAYGYEQGTLPVFMESALVFEQARNPYATPLAFTDAPLMSGYASDANVSMFRNGGAVLVDAIGRGRTVLFANSPLFRAHWYGTERLFTNAVLFGDTITEPAWSEE